MKWEYYNKHIEKRTKGKYDTSTLFENAEVFKNLIDDMIKPFKNDKIDKILCFESTGFVFGGAIGLKLNKPIVLMRRKGKLDHIKQKIEKVNVKDYSNKEKEFLVKASSIKKNDKILLVDDWIETGEQAKAAIELVERLGGKVVGIAVVNADRNNKTKSLFKKYNLKPVHSY